MSQIQDDKAQHCIPFILERLEVHRQRYAGVENAPPFFLGVNGVQGAGKTVLVSILQSTLQGPPHNLPTIVFSLDDVYLTHADQVALAQAHPDNPLLQHRGQPSTHDIPLALTAFASLSKNQPTRIPQYNKAAFSGEGDRVPESEWEQVNSDNASGNNSSSSSSSSIIKVVMFEGWSVGFRPLSPEMLQQRWEQAVQAKEQGNYNGRLGHNTLKSVSEINEALQMYNQITGQLDAFIHIDAQDPQYVYKWRLEQEAGLRAKKGAGMTNEQVRRFVDGYYPAYELFTDTLRQGVFGWQQDEKDKGRQLRLVVGEDRKVVSVQRI